MDKRKQLMPLVRQLAAEKNFGTSVLLTTDAAETVRFIVDANTGPAVTKADVHLGNAAPPA
jgi:hypothetical protein